MVDERGEIYPQELSGPDQQLPAVDTLSGIPKERAVQMALRTLSPQVIVLDELGSLAETAALEQGFFSGVDGSSAASAVRMADRNSPSGRKRATYPAAAAYCGIAAAHPAGSGIPQAGYGAALPLSDTGRAADACGKIAGSRAACKLPRRRASLL